MQPAWLCWLPLQDACVALTTLEDDECQRCPFHQDLSSPKSGPAGAQHSSGWPVVMPGVMLLLPVPGEWLWGPCCLPGAIPGHKREAAGCGCTFSRLQPYRAALAQEKVELKGKADSKALLFLPRMEKVCSRKQISWRSNFRKRLFVITQKMVFKGKVIIPLCLIMVGVSVVLGKPCCWGGSGVNAAEPRAQECSREDEPPAERQVGDLGCTSPTSSCYGGHKQRPSP